LYGAALALATAAVAVAAAAQSDRLASIVSPQDLAVDDGTGPIRVGVLLTGGRHAAASEDIAAGVTLALAEAGGSPGGREVEILREDAADRPGDAAERARRLIAARAMVLIGPATAREVAPLREVAHTSKVPLIVPVPGAAALALKCSPYVLHLAPAGEQVAGPLAAWIGARQAAKRIYLLAPDDAAAREMVTAFKRNFSAAGGEIAGEEYVAAPNPDFTPYLAKLRLMEADAVYALFTGAAAGTFMRQLGDLGLANRVALFSAGPVDGVKAAAVTGALDYVPTLDTPRNRAFREAFARLFGRQPTEHAARGYDAGRLIVEAIGSADGLIDREHLAAALTAVSFVGPRGPIRADPRRPAGPDRLYIVRAQEEEDGHVYEVIDHVAAGAASADVCATPRG
jgi:branched-chain amino acid transport system substrate-binding protein